MAVPKRKTSKSRKRQRRSHHALEKINIVFNKETGEPQLPHQISVDGYYNGRKVISEKAPSNQESGDNAKAN